MEIHPQLRTVCQIISRQLDPRLVTDDEWEGLIEQASIHGLAPMLVWLLEDSGCNPKTRSIWMPLIENRRQTALRYMLLEKAQRDLHHAFIQAGISCIWLKGIALAPVIYPQPELRPMSDLDVLVPYEKRTAALECAIELGYKTLEESPDEQSKILFTYPHHVYLMGNEQNPTALEIHHWLLGYDLELLPESRLMWFFQQTTTKEQGHLPYQILKPEAHLLYLAAHAILQHGEEEFYGVRFLDFHQLVIHRPLEWDFVVQHAISFKWSYALERALEISLELFATPIPAWVFEKLSTHSREDKATAYALLVKGRGSRGERFFRLLRAYSLSEALHLIIRVFLPPTAYMRVRYDIPPNQVVLPYYLYRWAEQGGDILGAIWNRLCRGVIHR
jgi:Uncharacterised nucleotidyltransferase